MEKIDKCIALAPLICRRFVLRHGGIRGACHWLAIFYLRSRHTAQLGLGCVSLHPKGRRNMEYFRRHYYRLISNTRRSESSSLLTRGCLMRNVPGLMLLFQDSAMSLSHMLSVYSLPVIQSITSTSVLQIHSVPSSIRIFILENKVLAYQLRSKNDRPRHVGQGRATQRASSKKLLWSCGNKKKLD